MLTTQKFVEVKEMERRGGVPGQRRTPVHVLRKHRRPQFIATQPPLLTERGHHIVNGAEGRSEQGF